MYRNNDFIYDVTHFKDAEYWYQRSLDLSDNDMFNYFKEKSSLNWIDIEMELEKNAFSHIDLKNKFEINPYQLEFTEELRKKIPNFEKLDKENYIQIKHYLKDYLINCSVK